MSELSPIGSTITQDGMIFRVTGHGTNHAGQPAEVIEFVGIAKQPGKVAKVRRPKKSVCPQVNLTGATVPPTVGSVLAPKTSSKPERRKMPRYSKKSEIVPKPQEGPPIAGILLVVGIIVAVLAWSSIPDPTYHGPPVQINHRR